jgi:hypothetical protein
MATGMRVPLGKFVLRSIVSQGGTAEGVIGAIGQANRCIMPCVVGQGLPTGLVRSRLRLTSAILMFAPLLTAVEK